MTTIAAAAAAVRDERPREDLWRDPETATAHQVLRREVNERIDAVSGRLSPGYRELELMCECARPDCTGHVTIDRADYHGLRRVPAQFLVKEGHDVLESERVVGDGDGYVIVAKREPG